MNILLTFTGFHDPYAKGLIGEEEQPGPILSLLNAKTFNHVILFTTPNTEKNTLATEGFIKKLYPNVGIENRQLLLNDPTNYIAILKGLRHHTRTIFDKFQDAHYFVATASGTPQMHACWVLLVASGEIPARILHVRPPKFVSKEHPIVSEIDLTLPDFPIVRANIYNVKTDDASLDVSAVIKKLGIVGDHPSIYKSIETATALAQSNIPILILGETGTGKEMFAKFVHLLSGRPSDLFIPINCAAIPENLVESILFGHKKGTFTGAINDQFGKFDQADGGTLFLDELGELPLSMQAKLLRVLQDGIVEPVGAKKSHKVNVRIIAATNKDLIKAIKKGHFREDLYYRLNIGEIRLPSLRERKSDIPKIALYVLDRINTALKRPRRLSPGALIRLQEHSWPGNVRDLENVIERSARLARRDVLEADDLLISEPLIKSDPLATLPEPSSDFSLEDFLSSVRKQMILRALELAEGNQSKAAKLLGITPQAVHKFLRNP
ncbi:MAG: RNA repair transcriptional activator RtcR family protein [Candidatus Loosdrechtia sp.]|uniref:sigma-54-dependent transcriptional regulator n=1 Tax=Candidatus Loosdrechtia sp. TaxID=3101272 RepID=UPI003A632150|nr:MAG: sigma-54 dependent transcriptional regulator [Candidatus Jettenia sp. AMX2]